MQDTEMSFWDHLDEFKKIFIRVIVCLLVAAPIVFVFKEPVFNILFAPSEDDFVLYRLFCSIGESSWYQSISDWTLSVLGFAMPDTCPDPINVALINTKLASQFMIHITTSLYVAILLTAPYLIYLIYTFVSPALYENEKKASFPLIASSIVLFLCGVLLNYFVIFPLSFRFLASYQVNAEIANMITLQSYISTFLSLSVMMGIVFEIPMLTLLMAKFGLVEASQLRKYRKHAFVVVVILAAAITPTGDAVTLAMVSLPMYLLYELSIRIIK